MDQYDDFYSTMLRSEEVECVVFQLHGGIDKDELPLLKGWFFDYESNEIWKKISNSDDKEIGIVKMILGSLNIKYDEPKEYMYIRIYEVDDPTVKGVDWLEDLMDENIYDLIQIMPCYRDENDYFFQYKKTPSNEQKYEYDEIKNCCEAYEYFKEQQRIAKEGVGEKTVEGKPRRNFEIGSVIVKTQSIKCQKEHTLEDWAGQVSVMNDYGEIQKFLVPITYCLNEDVWFMFDIDYQKLERYGKILCRVVDYHNYEKHGIRYYYGMSDDLAAKSVLKMLGYSVAKKDDLSPEQRQKILTVAIENGVMNKYEIISFLKWCHKNHHTAHPEAARKYLEDIDFLRYTDIEEKPVVEISEIIIK